VSISEQLKSRIRAQAKDRCGYCQSQQQYVLGLLEIDHIVPEARGGTDQEENLWLACRFCNLYKGTQTHAHDPLTGRRVRLFNPRTQKWSRHFWWQGPYVVGRTACGRATAAALNVNNVIAVVVRRNWMEAGWHPPK
jgi:hypothetical protein